ncbi:MAG: LTA synthase family protein, partial [Gammaproteobacteria bacterium]|nr:LTA synthase family protein [Gammaproteobacteria bacterium]
MAEFLERTWLAAAVGVLLSFVIEYATRPRPVHAWRRPTGAVCIHLGLWLLAFVAELGVFRRPWFAAANVDALFLGLVLINDAKLRALREAFVFQDFEYFTDALRHPRLYLPFFGAWRSAITLVCITGAILIGLSLELPLASSIGVRAFAAGVILLVALAAGLLAAGHCALPAASHEPSSDLERFGMLGFWWRYAADERRVPRDLSALSVFARAGAAGTPALPDLVAIQSESFFDARRCFPAVRRRVLASFDALVASAAAHGELQVAAWGANTVRSEFAFLSGLDPALLGVHRFNPYRRLARLPVPTVATYLKSRGYRTVCVHPYPVSFYRRDVVYPLLGFDQFIDLRAFAGAERAGPFVSDRALADKIGELLRSGRRTQPLFVFAITMENHGPLHLETTEPGEAQRLCDPPPPAGCEDLVVYLRHLGNADRMIETLRAHLESLARPAGLCFYGDHVPIMAKVYEQLGNPDGRTDYVIWNNGAPFRQTAPVPP